MLVEAVEQDFSLPTLAEAEAEAEVEVLQCFYCSELAVEVAERLIVELAVAFLE